MFLSVQARRSSATCSSRSDHTVVLSVRLVVFHYQADPDKLLHVLHVIRLSPEEQRDVRTLALAPAQVETTKSELCVQGRRQYPAINESLASSLRKVSVHNCQMIRIDARFLRLPHLQILDLSEVRLEHWHSENAQSLYKVWYAIMT